MSKSIRAWHFDREISLTGGQHTTVCQEDYERLAEQEKQMRTYLTQQIGSLTIVYYVCPHLGKCHVAYYTE